MRIQCWLSNFFMAAKLQWPFADQNLYGQRSDSLDTYYTDDVLNKKV